jgi:hypothetical protein
MLLYTLVFNLLRDMLRDDLAFTEQVSLLLFVFTALQYFICGIFYYAVSISDCISPNFRMINELETMWKKADVAYFKILSYN